MDPLMALVLLAASVLAQPEDDIRKIKLGNGEEYNIEGFSSYNRLLSKLDQYSTDKLKDSFSFICEIGEKCTSGFLSSVTHEKFDTLLLMYSIAKEDFVFANLLIQLGSSRHHNSERLKVWLESNVNFNATEFYEMVQHISKAKDSGLSRLPKYFSEQIVSMNKKYKAFEKACSNGDIEVVEWFIESGLNLQTVSCDVLSSAWNNNQLHVLKILLSNNILSTMNISGFDINSTVNSKTLLHITTEYGMVEASKKLIASGADVNAIDSKGWTPLFTAVLNNDLKMLKVLVEHGGNVKATSSKTGDSLIHLAISISSIDAVGELIKLGAPVNNPNFAGETPMYIVVKNSNVKMLYILTFGGGDLGFITSSGDTLVHTACSLGSLIVLKALITLGADIHKENDLGETPLSVAAKRGDTAMMEFLMSRGADLRAKDRKGMTLLHRAARLGDVTSASTLIKSGLDVDSRGFKGVTPLYVAADEGLPAMCEFLLNSGADPNATSTDGWTALHRAALWGFEDIATLLLKNRADPNATTSGDWTPLSLAKEHGHVKLYTILRSAVHPDYVDFDVRLNPRVGKSLVIASNDLKYMP